ncbi:MAG: diacylglycerol kinase family protein [Desulfobacterota bacterium]|nr:diacylglycerol kinase family protein [Thermodesulfobacteriota bacterium]
MKRTLCIINPLSGGSAGDRLRHRLLAEIKRRLPATAYDTIMTGRNAVRLPASDYETVIVAGGDGTVWQSMQQLMQRSALPRVAVIPLGTGNDLARASGMIQCLRCHGISGILDAVEQGKTTMLDILSLNNRFFFTNYYGIGIDATVAQSINAMRAGQRSLRLPGKCLYIGAGLRNAGNRLTMPVALVWSDTNGGQHSLIAKPGTRQIMVTNIPWYGGGARPSSWCRMDDGLFEVTIVEQWWQWVLLHLTRFINIPFDRIHRAALRFQTHSLILSWNGYAAGQLDGETLDLPAAPHTITCTAQLPLIIA